VAFDQPKSIDSDPVFDLHCPYCGFLFDKAPKSKKRCVNCHNVAYVKRPWGDIRKRLYTKEQASAVEADWKVQYAESVAVSERLAQQFREEGEELVHEVSVPFINCEEIGIVWWNSCDDQVCDKCSRITGQWFPAEEAYRLAKEIHPDGTCRCIVHFDVGRPSEALVGHGRVKPQMRPMTKHDLQQFDAFTLEHYGMTYEQFLQKRVGKIVDSIPK